LIRMEKGKEQERGPTVNTVPVPFKFRDRSWRTP
jgi:hypothetical protein